MAGGKRKEERGPGSQQPDVSTVSAPRRHLVSRRAPRSQKGLMAPFSMCPQNWSSSEALSSCFAMTGSRAFLPHRTGRCLHGSSSCQAEGCRLQRRDVKPDVAVGRSIPPCSHSSLLHNNFLVPHCFLRFYRGTTHRLLNVPTESVQVNEFW